MAPTFCCRSTSEGPNFKQRSFSWRLILSWSMIDFSNSLVLMIVTQLYPTFLQNFAFLDDPAAGVNKVSTANIVNAALLLVISPILGVISDYYFLRLPFVGFSALLYGVMTILLYLVSDASWRNYAITVFFFITFGFRINETFVSSFLPSLCNDRDMGFVSGLGYCVGFLSGTIVLAIVNMLTPQRITLLPTGKLGPDIPKMFADRQIAMLVTGIIMLLSILPPVLMLDNGIPVGEKRPKAQWRVFGQSFVTLGRTFKSGFTVNKNVTLLLCAYFLFITGCWSGTSVMGQIYTREATVHGFTLSLMTTCMTAYNVLVAFTSIAYGFLTKYTGTKPLLIFSIVAHMMNTLNSIFWKELASAFQVPYDRWAHYWLWVSMMLSALGMGPVQALLRGAVGVLAPAEKKCEVFGIMETFQLVAWLIGAIAGQQLYKAGYKPYFIFAVAWYVAALILICFIPITRSERAAREKNKRYGNATIDEIRQQELLEAAQTGNKAVEDAAVLSSTTTEVEHTTLSTDSSSPPLPPA